ncbi:hypothetical protein OIO90_004646 [Microbotryomycetes sp. JL221]|nr:hypothetical protein OIO90_004646 [Microbotryomycetes sp. JL221]
MSGKRAAEKQITDRDWDQDDHGDEEAAQSGQFAQAPAAEMATRKIRGLPQRKGAKASGPTATTAAPQAPMFGGFGATPTPFSALSAPTTVSSTTASNGITNGDGAAKINPFANNMFSFGVPAATTTAPAADAANPAAATFNFGAAAVPKPAADSASAGFSFSNTKKATPAADSPELKYYTALRGLNVSLIESLTAQVDRDPFVNFVSDTTVFDKLKQKYMEHRRKIQEQFDSATNKSGAAATTIPPISPSVSAAAPTTAKPATTGFSFAPSPTPPTSASSGFSFGSTASAPAKAKVEEPAKLAPPAPPAAFTFGNKPVTLGQDATSSSNAKPAAGGFVFNPSAPKDPYAETSKFAFPIAAPSKSTSVPTATSKETDTGSKPADSNATAKSAASSATASKFTPAAPSPLRFGTSGSSPTKTEVTPATADSSTKKPAGQFNFGASFGAFAKGVATTSDGKTEETDRKAKAASTQSTDTASKPAPAPAAPAFSFGAPPSASTSAAPPAFSFGSSAPKTSTGFSFGAPAATTTTTPTKSLSNKPQHSPPLATAFGGNSTPKFGFGAALGTNKDTSPSFKTSPGFTFGVGTGAATTTAPTGFGSGSTGFSFGSPTPAPAVETAAETAQDSRATSAAPSAAPSEATIGESADATAGATAPVAATDDGSNSAGIFGQGEGEEGETSLHQVRAKAFKLGGEEPTMLGLGVLSIKEKQGDDGKKTRRVLMRNEGNNSVMMNFRITPSFQPRVEKTFVSFLGFEGSEPATYRVRVKTKEMADELGQKLRDAAVQ